MLNIILSILIGSFYIKDSPITYQKIQNKIGILYLTTTNQAFGTVFNAINLFVSEKKIVLPEIENGKYNPFSYYVGRTISDIPFTILGPIIFGSINYFIVHLRRKLMPFLLYLLSLIMTALTASSIAISVSALVSTQEIASAIVTPFNIIFFIFAGVFINLDNLPSVFHWISKISYIKWCFQALMINEFKDQVFHCEPTESMCIPNVNQVLESYGFQEVNYWNCLLFLFLLYSVFYVFGFFMFVLAQRRVF